MNYNLLQSHTISIYDLKNHEGKRFSVPARNLLTVNRFDLFAKLYYIDNKCSNPESAIRVYSEHIKAFNPDEKEPGRTDKNGIKDFIDSFDYLISVFEYNEFDDSKSVIPVDKNGVILDGAHRVAALAYYNRQVAIVQFDDIEAKSKFDYVFFKDRGLSKAICDIIALEMIKWKKSVLAACVWPSNSKKQQKLVISSLGKLHALVYQKEISCNFLLLANFVSYIYRDQDWTLNNCAVQDKASRVYGKSKLLIVFFESRANLLKVTAEKEIIRSQLGRGKDSLHITDNYSETCDIAKLVLCEDILCRWQHKSNMPFLARNMSYLDERLYVLRKVQWLALKVKIYNMLKFFKKGKKV